MTNNNEDQTIIDFSLAAVDKIAQLIASRKKGPMAVRVVLKGRLPGGGYQSEFQFVPPADKSELDIAQDAGPFMVFIDPASANAIAGARVDFDEKKYAGGFNIEYPQSEQIASKTWDEPLSQSVQDVIDSQVNPALAGHGGWVTLLDVKEGTAYIEMGGGCHGCALSQMTLKSGIERIITENIDNIKRVLDRTDHAEGQNPYYAGGADGGASAIT